MNDLRSIARALGGTVAGGQVLFPPPGHRREDRSASLRLDPAAPGGFLVHTFSPRDDALVIKDYVRAVVGGDLVPDDLLRPAVARQQQRHEDEERTMRALAIWREARDPRQTPVERYLRGERGVELPAPAVGTAVRYHPSCPFGSSKRTPAMVCLVRDVGTDRPVAIHRTALTMTGQKVKIGEHDRLSFGPIGGGAIKLAADCEVGTGLGIGEGLESTLSLCLTPEFGTSPAWSLVSAGGIERFPILPGVECLWIAVDNDEAGVKAAGACAARWTAAGREVILVQPRAAGADLNDVVRRRGRG